MCIFSKTEENAIFEFIEYKICACTCCCILVSIYRDAYHIAVACIVPALIISNIVKQNKVKMFYFMCNVSIYIVMYAERNAHTIDKISILRWGSLALIDQKLYDNITYI